MPATKVYLAIDLGAESGRVLAGIWNGRRMKLDEIHRFTNGAVLLGDTLRWDVLRLWAEIQNGLSLAAKKYGKQIISVGADTWGVDFVLLDAKDEMLGHPFQYRDARTRGLIDRACRKVPRAEIFRQSGLQFMEINSLYQLLAWKKNSPQILDNARTLLFMPDFFHWALCGARKAEFTIASTSQFLHPRTGGWSKSLLKQLGLPTHFLPPIAQPGARLGLLRQSVESTTGLRHVKVVAPASHDTASAVVGVPARSTGKMDWAYLSSGTWSLMGVETPRANISPAALASNMTNEGGVDGTYRLLKNIMGLWLVQRCKHSFDRQGSRHDYPTLVRLAAAAKPLQSLINPNDPRFFNPPDMAKAIHDFCRETKQRVPKTPGEIVRAALESLALEYAQTLAVLEKLNAARLETIYIVGGGSQNDLLNQFTADACARTVVAGPVEASALGNVLIQARADGEIASLAEARAVVRQSSAVKFYAPQNDPAWSSARERYFQLLPPGR